MIAYVWSSVLGGLITGSILALIGQPLRIFVPQSIRLVLFALVLCLLLVAQIAGKAGRLSFSNFAVPAAWVAQGGRQAGIIWGLTLGLGWITWTGVLVNAYLVGALLSDFWWHSIIVGAVFGFCRATVGLSSQMRSCILSAADTSKGIRTVLTYWMHYVSLLVLTVSVCAIIMRLTVM